MYERATFGPQFENKDGSVSRIMSGTAAKNFQRRCLVFQIFEKFTQWRVIELASADCILCDERNKEFLRLRGPELVPDIQLLTAAPMCLKILEDGGFSKESQEECQKFLEAYMKQVEDTIKAMSAS